MLFSLSANIRCQKNISWEEKLYVNVFAFSCYFLQSPEKLYVRSQNVGILSVNTDFNWCAQQVFKCALNVAHLIRFCIITHMCECPDKLVDLFWHAFLFVSHFIVLCVQIYKFTAWSAVPWLAEVKCCGSLQTLTHRASLTVGRFLMRAAEQPGVQLREQMQITEPGKTTRAKKTQEK